MVVIGGHLKGAINMTDLSSVDPSQEDEDGVLTGDQPTEPSSTDDQATGKLDTVENDVIPSAVSEVARPVAAPPPAEDQPTKELRYTNPHGTFITGIDVSSEVGDAAHVIPCWITHSTCQQCE